LRCVSLLRLICTICRSKVSGDIHICTIDLLWYVCLSAVGLIWLRLGCLIASRNISSVICTDRRIRLVLRWCSLISTILRDTCLIRYVDRSLIRLSSLISWCLVLGRWGTIRLVTCGVSLTWNGSVCFVSRLTYVLGLRTILCNLCAVRLIALIILRWNSVIRLSTLLARISCNIRLNRIVICDVLLNSSSIITIWYILVGLLWNSNIIRTTRIRYVRRCTLIRLRHASWSIWSLIWLSCIVASPN
jgi:hypothetical protein